MLSGYYWCCVPYLSWWQGCCDASLLFIFSHSLSNISFSVWPSQLCANFFFLKTNCPVLCASATVHRHQISALYSVTVINLPSKMHIVTLLYFMNTLYLALLYGGWVGGRGRCCVYWIGLYYFVYLMYSRRWVEKVPLSGMVLISQISGRNKAKISYIDPQSLLLFSAFFLTVYSCYRFLLFTVSTNFSV